ncbi:hypothetical protein [Streptomyces sp. LS1784]|uniref:hypothetical protein n=1 Tax=Streptomyces sp. LS1784 TaxID=2851533 RepID=UPI001CC92B63|nr:hypothetical protein [Streptomyces sp. LS1784]
MTVPFSVWARLALAVPVTVAVAVMSLMLLIAMFIPSAATRKFVLASTRQVLALVRVLVPAAK